MQQTMLKHGMIEVDYPFDQIVDTSFVDEYHRGRAAG